MGNNFLVLNCQPRALEFPCLAFAERLGTVSGHTRNQASVTGKDRRRRGPSLPGCPWRVTFRGKLLKLSIAPVSGEVAGRSYVFSSEKGRRMQWGQTQPLSLHVTKQGWPWDHLSAWGHSDTQATASSPCMSAESPRFVLFSDLFKLSSHGPETGDPAGCPVGTGSLVGPHSEGTQDPRPWEACCLPQPHLRSETQ